MPVVMTKHQTLLKYDVYLEDGIMRRLAVVLWVVLAATGITNAAMKIAVNGMESLPLEGEPVSPGEHLLMGLLSDLTEPQPPFATVLYATGFLDISGGVNLYPGTLAALYQLSGPDLELARMELSTLGIDDVTSVIIAEFAHGSVPQLPLGPGIVVEQIELVYGNGVAGLLVDEPGQYPVWGEIGVLNYSTGMVYDRIYAIPEPMTAVLLGIGSLLIRRRK